MSEMVMATGSFTGVRGLNVGNVYVTVNQYS